MNSKFFILICFTLLLLNINKIQTKIFVRSPQRLVSQFSNNGEIKGSISKFGQIPYGYNLVGSLYYDNVALTNNDVSLGCDNSFTLGMRLNVTADIDESPIILLDRGDCSFVNKVTNAENYGAQAVLVVNNDNEDVDELVMADDGNGKYVNIPSELISQSDGQKLKKFMKENPGVEVSIEIDFEIVSLKINYFTKIKRKKKKLSIFQSTY